MAESNPFTGPSHLLSPPPPQSLSISPMVPVHATIPPDINTKPDKIANFKKHMIGMSKIIKMYHTKSFEHHELSKLCKENKEKLQKLLEAHQLALKDREKLKKVLADQTVTYNLLVEQANRFIDQEIIKEVELLRKKNNGLEEMRKQLQAENNEFRCNGAASGGLQKEVFKLKKSLEEMNKKNADQEALIRTKVNQLQKLDKENTQLKKKKASSGQTGLLGNTNDLIQREFAQLCAYIDKVVPGEDGKASPLLAQPAISKIAKLLSNKDEFLIEKQLLETQNLASIKLLKEEFAKKIEDEAQRSRKQLVAAAARNSELSKKLEEQLMIQSKRTSNPSVLSTNEELNQAKIIIEDLRKEIESYKAKEEMQGMEDSDFYEVADRSKEAELNQTIADLKKDMESCKIRIEDKGVIDELNTTINNLKNELNAFKNQAADKSRETELNLMIANLNKEMEIYKKELGAYKVQIADKNREVETINLTVANLKDEIEAYKIQAADKGREAELNLLIANLNKEKEIYTKELGTYKAQIVDKSKEIKSINLTIANLKDEIEAYKNQTSDNRSEAELNTTINNPQNELNAFNNQAADKRHETEPNLVTANLNKEMESYIKELGNYKDQIADKNRETESINLTVANLKDEIEAYKNQAADKGPEAELDLVITNLNKEMENYKNQAADKTREADLMNLTIARLKKEVEAFKHQAADQSKNIELDTITKLKKEIESYKDQTADQSKEVDLKNLAIASLKKEIEAFKSQAAVPDNLHELDMIAKLKQEIQIYQAQIADQSKEAELNRKIADLESKLVSQNHQASDSKEVELNLTIIELKKQIESYKQQLDDQSTQASGSLESAETSQQLLAANQTISDLKNEMLGLQSGLRSLQSELKTKESSMQNSLLLQIDGLKASLDEAKRRNQQLDSSYKSQELTLSNLRMELDASRKARHAERDITLRRDPLQLNKVVEENKRLLKKNKKLLQAKVVLQESLTEHMIMLSDLKKALPTPHSETSLPSSPERPIVASCDEYHIEPTLREHVYHRTAHREHIRLEPQAEYSQRVEPTRKEYRHLENPTRRQYAQEEGPTRLPNPAQKKPVLPDGSSCREYVQDRGLAQAESVHSKDPSNLESPNSEEFAHSESSREGTPLEDHGANFTTPPSTCELSRGTVKVHKRSVSGTLNNGPVTKRHLPRRPKSVYRYHPRYSIQTNISRAIDELPDGGNLSSASLAKFEVCKGQDVAVGIVAILQGQCANSFTPSSSAIFYIIDDYHSLTIPLEFMGSWLAKLITFVVLHTTAFPTQSTLHLTLETISKELTGGQTDVQFIECLCHMFAFLCKLAQDQERLRVLVYDLLAFGVKNPYLLVSISSLVQVWPSPLVLHPDSSDLCVQVFQAVLASTFPFAEKSLGSDMAKAYYDLLVKRLDWQVPNESLSLDMILLPLLKSYEDPKSHPDLKLIVLRLIDLIQTHGCDDG